MLILIEPDSHDAKRIGTELALHGVRSMNFVNPWRALAHLGSEPSVVVVVSSRLGQDALRAVVEAVKAETDFPVLIAYRPDETALIGPAVVAGGRPLITHPYDASEIARIFCEVLPPPPLPTCVEFGRLSLVPEWQDAHLGETGVDLSPLEFRVLTELALRAGRVASKEALVAAAWSGTSPDPKVLLAAAIKRIRHKFTILDVRDAVETVRAVGYRLNPAAFEAGHQVGASRALATPTWTKRSRPADIPSVVRRTS